MDACAVATPPAVYSPAARSASGDFTQWQCIVFVYFPVAGNPYTKKRFFSKTKQFRIMVSIDDQYEVVHGLFKEPIFGPLDDLEW